MDYNFYTLYIYSISYILSILLPSSVIPYTYKYNIEMLIAGVKNLLEKLFRYKIKIKKDFIQYTLINTLTVVLCFFATVLIIELLKIISIYVLMVFELILLYLLFSLRTVSDRIIDIYYSLLSYDEDNIKEQVGSLLKSEDINRYNINIQNYDRENVARIAIEIMSKYILEKGNTIIAAFFLGPAFAVLYRALNILFGNTQNKVAAIIYRIITIVGAYINSATLMLAVVILRLDYKNAFHIFMQSRNKKTTFGYNETLSIVSGALNISLGKPYDSNTSDDNLSDSVDLSWEENIIGDDNKEIGASDIKNAINIFYANSIILFALAIIFKLIVYISITWK